MITEQELRNIGAGAYGTEVITDTAAHAGLFGAITALEDSAIAAIACALLSGNSLVGKTLPKGVTIFLPATTSLTLASGAVLARRMPPHVLQQI